MVKDVRDEEILELLSNRQTVENGFRLLMQTYQQNLYHHIRRMVDNHADADDILQNTFVKIYRNVETFKGKSALYTWLYRIATNEALSYIRSTQARRQRQVAMESVTNAQAGVADVYVESEEIHRALIGAVEQLPEKQREVFIMRYYDEMPYEDIADRTGTSIGALKASYHHAVKKVTGLLKSRTLS